jgi:transcription elongation factor GreB
MSKAFTREDDGADEDDLPEESGGLPLAAKNYMTPAGFARMREELDTLMRKERPDVVKVVSWAAGNGDRSENGDYIYGKKRLREIDRRIRFLVRRLDRAEVVDPAAPREDDSADRVFFGATVTVADQDGIERTVSIVGIDEIDTPRGYISWISPMARALLKAREGDKVLLHTPGGKERLEILEVTYLEEDTVNGEDA